ncbi:D-alanine--D-alanine ligase family protein [Alicyclobacillus sp.]|uniref:D-alanine--D-alanine ligase family protein n=1 Tax=Alicyclobacillus sp. TaxID=61169 RepID=UPI0025BE15D5|nr:D-alanine--D-alanine ligase family protein [Alicyclobacillus sp.]MCL6515812.1 D-alanine--D-alanine ligase [Alicyclobacillus sp.]
METIAVIFGGRSVEHEVSVVTALQVMENLDGQRFHALPVYIAKDGMWYSHPEFTKVESFRKDRLPSLLRQASRVRWEPVPGSVLRLEPQETEERRGWFGKSKGPQVSEIAVDAVIPALHGTYGEDGALQGFLELTGVPYTSAGIVGSAVGMDKIVMKSVFRGCGIPVVPYEWFTRDAWEHDPDAILTRLTGRLQYPMFVKPCNLGSSVGISRAEDEAGLRQAIEIACHYDTRILVEQGIERPIEVNVSVLGDETSSRVSLCERPVSWEKFLTYDDKYIRGNFNKGSGAAREIPARLPGGVTERVQSLAQQAFHAVQARGVVRVDFLVTEDGEVFVNEINTIPGSFAFYLWEPAGLTYTQLLTELIDIAKRDAERRRRNVTTFDTDLLEKFQQGGKLGKMGKM